MKIVWIIIWLLALVAAVFGIYKASSLFDFADTIPETKTTIENKVKDSVDQSKSYAETAILSGKQIVASWAQQIILSWQALLDQKKKEAEAYLLQQKEQLKAEAQKALEEEAKRKYNEYLVDDNIWNYSY